MRSSASTSPRAGTSPRASGSPACTRSERHVVKVGGSLGPETAQACEDIRALVEKGDTVLVVHGGGSEADRLSAELGRPIRHLETADGRRSRYTDAGALDVLRLGLLGRVKPDLVAGLLARGIRAVGLSGADGGLVTATRKPAVRVVLDGQERVVRDDLAGRIVSVDPHLAATLLDAGYVPVVSPPAADPQGNALNVDADRVAARLATALGADSLVVLSDVPGMLRDRADPASVVRVLPCGALPEYLALAGGRMKVKLQCAAEARLGGVRRVVLAAGHGPSPVRDALAGEGTTFVEGPR